MGLRCLHTSVFIETPVLEGLPTKAKEDPSPHEMRLNQVFPGLWDFIIIITIIIIIIIIIIMIIIIIITIIIIIITLLFCECDGCHDLLLFGKKDTRIHF